MNSTLRGAIRTVCIAFLLNITPVSAQDAKHDMVANEKAVSAKGRIAIGQEFVPKFAALHAAESLVVPEGQTVTIHESAEYHSIEVAGTLAFCKHCDITLRCVNLQVLETGVLDMGTPEAPVAGKLDIVILDKPIDVDNDPYQWGNGIFVLGKWFACGTPAKPWSIAATPRRLADVDAWKKSLTYDTQRNITVRSERASGVRGHTVVTKMGYADIRHVAFLDLGRTLPIDLDSTRELEDGTFYIGKNPVARYVFHWHHNHPQHFEGMSENGRLEGCYINSGSVNKWGVVIHGTHFVTVTENVISNLVGAGIITEDGNETQNVIARNLLMNIRGTSSNGPNDKLNQVPPRDNPGAAGSGIWLHGNLNRVQNNLSVNCSIGMQAFYRNFHESVLAQLSPRAPGLANDQPVEYKSVCLLESEGNIALDCDVGFETWNAPPGFTMTEFSALRCENGVKMGSGEPGHLRLVDSLLLGSQSSGISSSAAYASSLEIVNCHIVEGNFGMHTAKFTHVRNSHFNNQVDMHIRQRPRKPPFEIVDCQLAGQTKLEFHLPRFDRDFFRNDQPIVQIHNWNGTQQDYIMVETAQFARAPVALATKSAPFASPVEGSVGEVYAKFGMAPFGYSHPEEGLVELPGVVGAKAKPGLDFVAGPPRLVVCYPNASTEPLNLPLKSIRFYLHATGEALTEDSQHVFEIDGIRYQGGIRYQQTPPVINVLLSRAPHAFSVGKHLIRTWVERDFDIVAGSVLQFSYSIGKPIPAATLSKQVRP